MVINVDTALWGLVIGTALPILVALVTAQLAPKPLKTVVLMFLATIITVGQELLAAGSFEVKEALLKFALLFLTSVGLHFGLLKPIGVTGQNGIVQQATPGGLDAGK